MLQNTSTMAKVVRHSNCFKLLLLITAWMAFATGVTAVDIQGFSSSTACSGEGFTFEGIAQRICAVMDVGAVLIRDLSSCQTGRVYRDGGCTTLAISGNGPDVRCFLGGSFTGADWLNGCTRRRLQADETSRDGCTAKGIPNGVHYTASPSMGSWIFKTPNATQVMDQLIGIDDANKVEWLKALGAYYVPGTDTFKVV